MKVLMVCSKNSGKIAPFITEQAESLVQIGVQVDFFTVEQKGIMGYLKNQKPLMYKINEYHPDIIHAHYGLSGLLANFQRNIPVITTYHGSDINEFQLRIFSIFTILLSKYNIFVSKKQVEKVKFWLGKNSVIPCGVDYTTFFPVPKSEARLKLGLSPDKKLILFSSTFDRVEKNASLAIEAVKKIPGSELIELKGFTRDEVCLLMNACDVGLLTSLHEGSPMFVKELLACNRPIVSTNVGDVEELISDIDGCSIVPFNVAAVTKAIQESHQYEEINVPESILERNNNQLIAKRLISVYNSVLNSKLKTKY